MQGRGEKWEASNEAAVIGTVRKRREIENQKKKREEENMSLKNNKYARRLAAALMTGAMMVSMMGMTAMAEEPTTTDESVRMITKVLNKDNNLYSPTTDFTFTIVPETENLGTIDGVSVKTGPQEGVLFDLGGGGTGDSAAISSNPELGAVAGTSVELGSLSIVIEETKFAEAGVGIYRYRIEETDSAFPGVDYDETDKYLDVHVTNKKDGGYDYAYTIINSSNPEKKGDGTFTNSYKKENGGLYDLTIEKNIEGNQANLQDTFTFSIKIDSDVEGEKFYVVVFNEGGDETGQVKTVVGDDQTAQTVELGDDQYAVIYGLSARDVYTVTETGAASGELDQYKTTIAATGTMPTIDDSNRSAGGSLAGDATVTFTNTRNVDTPTGVILNIAPYILMVALAGVLAFFFLRKRHYEM